jgi:hypothetical protein
LTAPAGSDNSTKVPTTAWTRTYISSLGYVTGNQSISITGDATGSGTTSINVTLANTAVSPGTYGSATLVPVVTVDSKGRITSVTTASISGALTFTGDVTGTGTTGTSTGLTLANSGVTAGTYTKVTVDSKGRVTVGASATTTDIAEGTRLYYTDARVLAYLGANSYATQSYVSTQINNLVSGAPGLLDTLDELAQALGDDPNFATTTATSLGNRLRIDTASQGLNSTQQANGRTNLGLGTAALSATGDFVAFRTFGTAANNNTGDFATAAQGTKADTAHGWGNHASAGYLTSATAATTYLTQSTAASTYLTLTNAASTYLSQTSAGNTYLTLTNAASTYLSQTSASNTYLTLTNAASTYLSQASASSNYLTLTNAASTYLTQSSASSSYVSLSGSYANPSWITSLAYSKITGVPAFLTSYTETDPFRVTSVAVSGTSTKTITLTRADSSTVSTTWTDIDTDTNTFASSLGFSGGTLTLTNNNASTVAVSLDGRYLQSYSETDTLASVTARGASTTATLTITRTDITNIYLGNAIYFGGGNNYLNWTNNRIYSNVGIESASTISASNFSGSSSGTNTGDQTLSGLGGQPQLNGTGFVKISGTTISYDNSTYLTSLPSHNHDGRYIRLDTVNEQDGIVAYFRPVTSGGYTMMKFESKVNQASDYGWILMQDDSANTNGAPGTEDIRMTIGVFNDFQGPGVHSDELWFQGGARLVQNVGSWDSEYNTIIGTPAAKTNGTTYEWRINNSSVMAISFDGVLSVGGNTVYHAGNLTNLNQLTNGPGYITGESDTLSKVVARGSTTASTISVGNSSVGTTGINILRGRLSFSNSYEANHSIYNNILNIDGLGAWDGMKMNVYLGLDVRTGNHDIATTILAVRPSGVVITGTISATNLSGTNTGDQTNISGLAGSETLATVVGRGNSTGGGRPITLDNGGGSIIVKASAGGWSMGTYYRGSGDTLLAGFGAYGGNDSLTWAWVGPGYESPWLTLNGSAVNSQVALQQGGNQVWHAGNLRVNYYQEDTSTLIPIGPYDKFVWGTGDRAAALIINDTAGARYAITGGSYDLSFYKHNSSAGTAVRAFYIDGNGTAGINNVTFETPVVGTNFTINRDLGTNDYLNVGQHNMQLRIRKASLDGGCAPRTLELGVLDNGTGVIQASHCGVGYNTLALNPASGAVTIGGNTAWHAGNLTNLNQLTNGPGYITGESDTLASVTGRGASTSTAVTFSGGLNVATSKVGFRNAGLTEFIQGEAWTMGIYGYNYNDGFLFFQRDTSDVARPCFHIGGWNNASYGGYSNADSMITLVRGDGVKSEGSTYATRGLSSSSYYSNIIKTTGGTVFRDSQSSHSFTGSVVVNGTGIYTAGDGGAGSQATVVAIRVRGLSAYESLELGTENNYDGVIRSYGNDIRYYSGHWRTVGNVSSENHSHYWYTSKAGSTNWSNHKMRLDHDGVLTVASHISTPGNVHANRSRLAFSSTAEDANHSIYNNYNNIDGEGSFDGMKINAYAGLLVRVGNASGAVPTTALDVTSTRTSIATGQLWCGASNSRDNAVGLVLNDGALHVRAHNDFYHKIWYYDGIAFGTNSAHGHFRFYAETASQRGSTSGGATLRFDMDSTNGNFWAGGDVTAYSDARVKTDVKPIENSIEKIQAIRGVTFLRTDAQEQYKEKRHAGVIAQEVLEVLPEVVTENNEGMYSVAYGNLVALLIEGIKEQQLQIEDLKNKLDLLTQNK